MRTLWKRIAALFRSHGLERDWNDEIATHLAMQEEEFRQRGMSADEAKVAARREFGGVAQTAEFCRDRRGVPWIETSLRDLRYALRGLARNRGFTTAAVLSLALGIGANTAIFSMYHALLVRQLPVRHPEELVSLYRTGAWGRGFCSFPFYQEVRKQTNLFSGVIGRTGVEKAHFRAGGGGDRFESAAVEYVTGNYFDVLGISPAAGHFFADDNNTAPRSNPIAVLSYDFWQRRFGGDPHILGQTITVDQDQLTVVGVAPRGFRGVEVEHHPDVWAPVVMSGNNLTEVGSFWLWIVGRRRPEVPVTRVQPAMRVVLQRYLEANYGNGQNAAFRKTAMMQQIEVRPGGIGLSSLRETFATPLLILMGAVGLVLLAACANIANLLLARGAARQKEIALRLSLGATRSRLVRQALTESLLLASCGSLLGVLFAWWGQEAILQFLPASSGEPFHAAPDATALLFTIGITAMAAILFGLAPAWRSTSVDPAECMKSGGAAGMRHSTMRQFLVVAQVAFSVMLVALAGLFGHSLAALRSINLGFRNQSVIAVLISGEWNTGRMLPQMESLSGVSMVSFGSPGPFQGGYSSASLRVPGSELTARDPAWVYVQKIAPRYFEILGSPPLTGREFDRTDRAGSPKVALVNQAFLRAFLPGEKYPLNRVINFDDRKVDPVAIVGVVRDIPHMGLREKISPTVYLPVAQDEVQFGAILLRTTRTRAEMAAAIHEEMERLGPQISASEPKTIRERIDDSIFEDRLVATVGGFFGGLALVLAVIGLYGVMAYSAARRAREIGIRIAMGAGRGGVLWMVLRRSLALIAAGLVVGIPISLLAARKVAPVLFRVGPDDSVTFVSTAAVLFAAGLLAAFLPARRAASIDPMRVLRQD